jgi:hypothetical protein
MSWSLIGPTPALILTIRQRLTAFGCGGSSASPVKSQRDGSGFSASGSELARCSDSIDTNDGAGNNWDEPKERLVVVIPNNGTWKVSGDGRSPL